jgi:hypothetical protein
MEAVGLVASIATLLKVCGRVGQLVISIRDAPREFQDLARTVDSLKLVVKEVESKTSYSTITDTAALHYHLLQAESSLFDLSALIGDVSDPTMAKSGARLSVVKWPLKKRKANAILQALAHARDGIAIQVCAAFSHKLMKHCLLRALVSKRFLVSKFTNRSTSYIPNMCKVRLEAIVISLWVDIIQYIFINLTRVRSWCPRAGTEEVELCSN